MQDHSRPQPHRRRGEVFWRRAVLAQRESGSTQQEFCRRNGLSLSTFQRWRRRLAEVEEGSEPSGFVEVKIRSEDKASEPLPARSSAASFELIFESGVRLRLPHQVEGRALAEVLWALEVTGQC